MKVGLIVACDYKGILMCAVAVGTTVNAAYYRNCLEHEFQSALYCK
jgi:hypothetical protein